MINIINMRNCILYICCILLLLPLVVAEYPGQKINTSILNISNVTGDCYMVASDVYINTDAEIGTIKCNITGLYWVEEVSYMGGSGGGGSSFSKKKILIDNSTIQEEVKPSILPIYVKKPKETPISSQIISDKPTTLTQDNISQNKQQTPKESNWLFWIFLTIAFIIIIVILIVIIIMTNE